MSVCVQYSMLHIAPPMSTPSVLWNCPLVDASNFVQVDKLSLQHVKYKNVFALGDCSTAPTSKTAAACGMFGFLAEAGQGTAADEVVEIGGLVKVGAVEIGGL